MGWSIKTLFSLLAPMVLSLPAAATERDASDRYAGIHERNAFGLKPPERIIVTNPPPQLPKLVLTGITTILETKRALLKQLPKPGEQGKELSLILTEGQREGEVEVLQIDENAGSVKVNNAGTVMTLTFEKDGARLPNTPPAVFPNVVPGAPLAPAPPPINWSPPGTLNANAAVHGQPRKILRAPGMVATPSALGALPTVAYGEGNGLAPGVGAAAPLPGAASYPAPAQDLTAEEQMIVEQVRRQVSQNGVAFPGEGGTNRMSLPAAAPGIPGPPQNRNWQGLAPQ